MKAQSKKVKAKKCLSLNEILINPVAKILDKYQTPTEYASYPPGTLKKEENRMILEFRRSNRLNYEAQKATLQELSNVRI